jgi:hypothetical protein
MTDLACRTWLQDYLKWKRQQKGAAGDSSDEEQQQGSADTGTRSSIAQLQAGRDAAAAGSGPTAQVGAEQQRRQQRRAPDSTADDPTQPLQYRPLVAVPAAPFTAAAGTSATAATAAAEADDGSGSVVAAEAAAQADGAAAGVLYMPRLDPAEVGFTPEGFALDMPTRPAWQVRRNAPYGASVSWLCNGLK